MVVTSEKAFGSEMADSFKAAKTDKSSFEPIHAPPKKYPNNKDTARHALSIPGKLFGEKKDEYNELSAISGD